MTFLRDDEVLTNLAMFKRYRFYQLFNPDGPTAFGYNVHRSLSVASLALFMAVNAYSALSYFTDYPGTVDEVDLLMIKFAYSINVVTFLKIAVFLCKADAVWDLFDFARLDFLTSGRCRANAAVLRRHRVTAIRLTDYFMNYTAGVLSLWCAVPLAYNALTAGSDDPDRRNQNVFNLLYPVPAPVFNRYFPAFYLMEVVMGLFLLYNAMLTDIFIVLTCIAAAAQYEVLGKAFASVGLPPHDDESGTSHGGGGGGGVDDDGYKNNSLRAYKDFVSILNDQIQVYKKLKSFYSVIWIIIVLLMFLNSIVMIILSYSLVVVKFNVEKSMCFKELEAFCLFDRNLK